MKRWDQRPFEIRNLFNPAFCGLVLFRAMEGYEEEDRVFYMVSGISKPLLCQCTGLVLMESRYFQETTPDEW